MEEPEDDANIIEHLREGNSLRLVYPQKREGLLPDPELNTHADKMKDKQERLKLRFDDGPEAA